MAPCCMCMKNCCVSTCGEPCSARRCLLTFQWILFVVVAILTVLLYYTSVNVTDVVHIQTVAIVVFVISFVMLIISILVLVIFRCGRSAADGVSCTSHELFVHPERHPEEQKSDIDSQANFLMLMPYSKCKVVSGNVVGNAESPDNVAYVMAPTSICKLASPVA